MARCVDADEVKKAIEDLPNCPNGYSDTYDKACIIGMLEEVPTADVVERKDLDEILEAHEQIGYEKGYRDGYAQAKVVEVVRCKECVHHKNAPKTTNVWCENMDGLLPKDWFCADGERRDDEESTKRTD